MFTVFIDKSQITEGMDEVTNRIKYWEKLARITLTQKLLKAACPAIEANLKSARNLPNHAGKKAFYDTETEGAMSDRGTSSRGGFLRGTYVNTYKREEHLLDCWKVAPVSMAEGGNVIRISNSKNVKGKFGEYSLFRLLWEGTNYFIMPVKLTNADIALAKKRDMFKHYEDLQPYERRNQSWRKNPDRNWMYVGPNQKKIISTRVTPEEKMANRLAIIMAKKMGTKPPRKLQTWKHERNPNYLSDAQGKFDTPEADTINVAARYRQKPRKLYTETNKSLTNWDHPQLMSFYCRYAGKFYYNQTQRRGIERPMVQEFHEHVADCVYDGMYSAIDDTFRSGTATQQMKKVFTGMFT